MKALTEEEAQILLQRSMQNNGWRVTNVHEVDRRNENGADLDCEKKDRKRLVAVKIKPRGSDIAQLENLVKRAGEGELVYAYFDEPTVSFRKKIEELQETVTFLGPSELHSRFVRNEVVDYLVHYFTVLPISLELANSVATLWESRKTTFSIDAMSDAEFQALWSLKDSILKTRAAVAMVAAQWDSNLRQRTELSVDEFDRVLCEVVRDLDHVQRFNGGAIAREFHRARTRTPQILALIWSLVKDRSYWGHFVAYSEQLATRDQVYEFARRYWVVPSGTSPLPSAKHSYSGIRFFCSGLAGILSHLAIVTKDLDDAVDLAWREVVWKRRPT